ncbi:MAG: ABC transporter permease subunit [Myxococcales bacterium]|nr:ABC transporter permease subunit [Myxococcales bacterium]
MSAHAPAAPGFGSSTLSMIRLTALRTLRGRKLRVAAVAAFVVILFPAVVALVTDDGDPVTIVTGGIDWGFFRLLVFLLPLLFTSGAIGEEVEARTLHFLAMRPISRASIALGKYVVGTGSALAILWVGLLLLHGIGYAASPSDMIDQLGATMRAGGAASLLLVLYCAIAMFWSTMVPEAGGLLTVIWLGFVEWFGMLLPGVLRFASMSHFARELGGLERAGWDPVELMGQTVVSVPDVELWICALVVVCEWAAFLAMALAIMQTAQLRFGKA